MRNDGMKVVALGAGEMGRWAARTVLLDDRVEEMVVADIEAEAAERTAAALGPRTRPAQVDVRDSARLCELLRKSDVVLNTVGPFYRFGVPSLRAAVEARCDYLDICDDWEPNAGDAGARCSYAASLITLPAMTRRWISLVPS
jgi:saccharopine dehydrogenase-like NADP-dependent oxidoreductase